MGEFGILNLGLCWLCDFLWYFCGFGVSDPRKRAGYVWWHV